ncbi:MAG: hypothetical protein E7637_08320 [Ruminococcaceae bacterium]|nr:hypothetical protein [Oscillospiraceae bacterium]
MKKTLLVFFAMLMCLTVFLVGCDDESSKDAGTNGTPTTLPETIPPPTSEAPASSFGCTHYWMEATCVTPKTCLWCDKTEGAALGHEWRAASSASCYPICEKCYARDYTSPSHYWVDASCDKPKHCLYCGEQEGEPLGVAHTWVDATCKAPKTCSVCGETEGRTAAHTYTKGVCDVCGQKDPTYIPTYGLGETWIVDGQWELTFKTAVHLENDSSGKQVVQISWTAKNLGYTREEYPYDSGELGIDADDLKVYDAETEVGVLDVWSETENGCIIGTKATNEGAWTLNNTSTTIKVYVQQKNSYGVLQKAWFELPVTPMPESDKLNGCTVTVDSDLPKKIDYKTYSGSTQSSCLITEISFEVSGDDLYIYFTGKKTYDSRGSGQSDSCKIGWKLYDSSNNVIESGTTYTTSVATGEGFVNVKDYAWDCIVAGESYRLVLLNVN